MRKSFYHYAMKYRGAKSKNKYSQFAEEMYKDPSFPKQSDDYDEISSYIEINDFSLGATALFDHMWEKYTIEEKL